MEGSIQQARSRPSVRAWTTARLVPLLLAGLAAQARAAQADRPPRAARDDGLWRGGFTARPFVSFDSRIRTYLNPQDGVVGGMLLHHFLEYNGPRGLLLRGELGPVTLASQGLGLQVRLAAGYTRSRFSVAAAVASGYPAFFPQLGPMVRIGRFDGTFAQLHLAWVLYPALPYPLEGAGELSIATSPRVRLHVSAGGGVLTGGVYGTVGPQIYLLGTGLRRSLALTAGLGLIWNFGPLGPVALFGLESRR
jgi:hypothetical protein